MIVRTEPHRPDKRLEGRPPNSIIIFSILRADCLESCPLPAREIRTEHLPSGKKHPEALLRSTHLSRCGMGSGVQRTELRCRFCRKIRDNDRAHTLRLESCGKPLQRPCVRSLAYSGGGGSTIQNAVRGEISRQCAHAAHSFTKCAQSLAYAVFLSPVHSFDPSGTVKPDSSEICPTHPSCPSRSTVRLSTHSTELPFHSQRSRLT